MSTEDRLAMFSDTLAMIKNTELLEFAKTILSNADDYFFEMPASTTGKYHPDFAHGIGGLTRHTRAVALFAATIASSFEYSETETDELIVAAIAHDIKKKGNGNGKWTTKDHPVCAYEYIKTLPHDGVSDETVDKIALAVRSHMGQWGDYKAETEFQKALQAADLLASRKFVDIKFQEASDISVPAPAPVLNEIVSIEPKDVVLTFGKYTGKTFGEIGAIDKGYLRWCSENLYQESLRAAAAEAYKALA